MDELGTEAIGHNILKRLFCCLIILLDAKHKWTFLLQPLELDLLLLMLQPPIDVLYATQFEVIYSISPC